MLQHKLISIQKPMLLKCQCWRLKKTTAIIEKVKLKYNGSVLRQTGLGGFDLSGK